MRVLARRATLGFGPVAFALALALGVASVACGSGSSAGTLRGALSNPAPKASVSTSPSGTTAPSVTDAAVSAVDAAGNVDSSSAASVPGSASNPLACPAAWTTSLCGAPCPEFSLSCDYTSSSGAIHILTCLEVDGGADASSDDAGSSSPGDPNGFGGAGGSEDAGSDAAAPDGDAAIPGTWVCGA